MTAQGLVLRVVAVSVGGMACWSESYSRSNGLSGAQVQALAPEPAPR